MSNLAGEIAANFAAFDGESFEGLRRTREELAAKGAGFRKSYEALTTLQAWRSVLLAEILSRESLEFFLEAQNDGLVSHSLARMGMWRPALQSLRSCIENVLSAIYYMDHPVEVELWSKGRHRLAFSELFSYCERHPHVEGVPLSLTGLKVLKSEYSVLSRAVHGSAKSFRMTDGRPEFWSSDKARFGAWRTREQQVLTAINQLLVVIFRTHLHATRKPALREVIGLALPKSKHALVKKALGVSLS